MRAVLYSEGLFIKETEVGMSLGQVGGQRRAGGSLRCSGHIHGVGSQAGGGDVSLLPRDHAERRACMRDHGRHRTAGRPRVAESQSGGGWQRPPETGVLGGEGVGAALLRDGRGDRLAPHPSRFVKGGREDDGALEEQDDNVGTPLLLPQSDPYPVRKLETSGIKMHGGGVGRGTDRRTDKRALADRIRYKKSN